LTKTEQHKTYFFCLNRKLEGVVTDDFLTIAQYFSSLQQMSKNVHKGCRFVRGIVGSVFQGRNIALSHG
jgi:hypothetical protein